MKSNNVQCPNCQEVFKVDDAIYNDIVKQVRDQQFQDEISNRLEVAEKQKQAELQMLKTEVAKSYQEELVKREKEITELKHFSKSQLVEELAKKDKEISDLKLQSQTSLTEELSRKDEVIRELESTIKLSDNNKQLAVATAVRSIEKERDDLQNKLNNKDIEQQLSEKSLQEQFQNKLEAKEENLRMKDEEIARLKDFKQKLSTKMMGETLEQHCETSFNQIRATAFPNAYFEKDNDASGGTKGDYIFKESDEQDNEIVSIMFEMKNENDTTATKKRNEDFFAKLDKDRIDKGCEYAVLVSMLESDSALYNNGIVDVSYKYPKMYVIRPQFFIPMITLLRNAAMNSLQYKQELSVIRNQNIDVTNFEEKLNKFREGFNKNYFNAANQFDTAMSEIDKSIDHLNKIKEALRLTSHHLRLANNKAEDLTIKKLTHNNPTMKKKFNDLKE